MADDPHERWKLDRALAAGPASFWSKSRPELASLLEEDRDFTVQLREDGVTVHRKCWGDDILYALVIAMPTVGIGYLFSTIASEAAVPVGPRLLFRALSIVGPLLPAYFALRFLVGKQEVAVHRELLTVRRTGLPWFGIRIAPADLVSLLYEGESGASGATGMGTSVGRLSARMSSGRQRQLLALPRKQMRPLAHLVARSLAAAGWRVDLVEGTGT